MNNITKLPNQPAGHPDLSHALTLGLFRHWRSLRRDGRAPRKSDLDLREIRRALPFLGIIGRTRGADVLSWRLAGSGLCEMWGRELKGEEALADWPAFERKTMTRLLDRVIERAQPVVARLKLKGGETFSDLPVEILAVPLRDEKTGAMLALVAMIPLAEMRYQTPRAGRSAQLTFLRVLATEEEPAKSAESSPRAPSGEGAGHIPFRVIEGGRAR